MTERQVKPEHVLRRVDRIEEAAALRDMATAKQEFAALLGEPYQAVLADMMEMEDGSYPRVVARLKLVSGLKSATSDLDKMVRAVVDRRKQAALAGKEDVRYVDDELRAAGFPPLPEGSGQGLRMPYGYAVAPGGIVRSRQSATGTTTDSLVCPLPMFITSRVVDVETNDYLVELTWLAKGVGGDRWSWVRAVVDRGVIARASDLVTLASRGAPVTTANSSFAVRYLVDFETVNIQALPQRLSSSHLGWTPYGSFILPDVHYLPPTDMEAGGKRAGIAWDAVSIAPPRGLERLGQTIHTRGTWEGWVEAMKLVRDRPLMMIALLASAASPLLAVFNAPNFIVDFSGVTSAGKTTALRFAASLWGYPSETDGYILSWIDTRVSHELTAAYLHNLPLILDDHRRVRDTDRLEQAVYDFASGRGKSRGTKTVGLRVGASWRAAMLTSGEAALVDRVSAGGAHARVLTLRGRPLGDDSERGQRLATDLNRGIFANYGHLGRRVARYLAGLSPGERRLLRDGYNRLYDRVGAVAAKHSPVAARLASSVAAMAYTATILQTLGLPEFVHDPLRMLMVAASVGGTSAHRYAFALDHLYEWASMNKSRFYLGRGHGGRDKAPTGGWAGIWLGGPDWKEIGFAPVVVREVLAQAGFDYAEIEPEWSAKGWITIRHGGVERLPRRVVFVRRSAVNDAVKIVDEAYASKGLAVTAFDAPEADLDAIVKGEALP